ncbi:MAG: BrnT family toxin [Ignavibacteriae bacterium]|nr:BrnT family toxin [Ignavibacteriota bacterium]
MAIKFEWDIEKASFNNQKHGVTFQEAKTICDDEFAAFVDDPNHSKGEFRYIMIGYSNKNNLLFVSFTDRENKIRIISARKATKSERKRHEENKGKY